MLYGYTYPNDILICTSCQMRKKESCIMKKSIAWLLCVSIVLSLAVWGIQSQIQTSNPSLSTDKNTRPDGTSQDGNTNDLNQEDGQLPNQDIIVEDLNREDKELIVEVIGGTDNTADLTDEELNVLVEELLESTDKNTVSNIVNLGNTQKPNASDDAAWKTEKAATCTSNGSKRRDCNNCDHYETATISKTGHKYVVI